MPGKHWVNLELLYTEANDILQNFVADLGGDVLQMARMDNPAKKTVNISGRKGFKLNYEAKASGSAAGMLGFDYSFRVPPGGFRPPPGRKAFLMVKPEGRFVYRARIYNKLGSQTVKRRGFFSEAMRNEIMSLKGQRRQQGMINAMGKKSAQFVADAIAADLRLIPGIRTMVIK
jgi:hypothetical protein